MSKTELVFILDRSGSMESLTDDTIGGFNSILKEHAEKGGEVLVTTYLFSDRSVMIHDRLPIDRVPCMTRADYRAGGCTALVDAIGEGIDHIAGIHRYARKEDIPARTLFVITTDGMENASRKYGAEQIREKIRHEKEKYGWEFVFLAANIDAVETAARYGIDASRAVDYMPDGGGTDLAYKTMGRALNNLCCRGSLDGDPSWRMDADKDYQKRRK